MLRVIILLLLSTSVGVAHTQHLIPFELKDNLVNVHALINGKKNSAVLDSGTGTVIVSKHLAASLNLRLGHTSVQAAGGGTKSQSLFPVKLRDVRFGPIRLKNVSGYALNIHSLSSSAGFTIDALVGYPMFANHVISVDYPNRQVSIDAKHEPPACRSPIPIKIEHGVPVVTAKLKFSHGKKVKTLHLVVDLGTRHYAATSAAIF